MPRQDGTGPEGKGSMTGRGAGKCGGQNKNQDGSAVSNAPLGGGPNNTGGGRGTDGGRGRGGGGGRGRGGGQGQGK